MSTKQQPDHLTGHFRIDVHYQHDHTTRTVFYRAQIEQANGAGRWKKVGPFFDSPEPLVAALALIEELQEIYDKP